MQISVHKILGNLFTGLHGCQSQSHYERFISQYEEHQKTCGCHRIFHDNISEAHFKLVAKAKKVFSNFANSLLQIELT